MREFIKMTLTFAGLAALGVFPLFIGHLVGHGW